MSEIRFKVYHDDYRGDDPWVCYARSYEDAAQQYAKHFDEADPILNEDSDVCVDVERAMTGERKRFRIGAYLSKNYTATEIPAATQKGGG